MSPPEHRPKGWATASGQGAKRLVQPEHLVQRGPPALEYLTDLVHRSLRL